MHVSLSSVWAQDQASPRQSSALSAPSEPRDSSSALIEQSDPCAGVARPSLQSKPPIHIEIVRQTLGCLKRLREPVEQALESLEHLRTRDFSQSLSDSAGLANLVQSANIARSRMSQFREQVINAVRPRLASFEREIQAVDPNLRWASRSGLAWVLLLVDGAPTFDALWLKRVERLSQAAGFSDLYEASRGSDFGEHTSLVSLWIAYLSVPSATTGPVSLVGRVARFWYLGEQDQPLRAAALGRSRFLGTESDLNAQITQYRQMRQLEAEWASVIERGTLSVRPTTWPEPVRLAVMDSGFELPIDALEHGRMPWISLGEAGNVVQGDFADGDFSPLVPNTMSNGHGTRTLSVLHSQFAQLAPELLARRRLQIGLWKVVPSRAIFAHGGSGQSLWTTPDAPFLATRYAASLGPGDAERAPQIVSVSMYFPIFPQMERADQRDLLLQTPWLWVMTAGNRGRDLSLWKKDTSEIGGAAHSGGPTCFEDVPPLNRIDAHILCVGGVQVQDDGSYGIAPYSGTGARVDVYTSVVQTEWCASGTSCSTPAVASAAGILLARFPKLTPALLKQAIVQSAPYQTVQVCRVAEGCLSGEIWSRIQAGQLPMPPGVRTMRVRIFDPAVHLPRALELAERFSLYPPLQLNRSR